MRENNDETRQQILNHWEKLEEEVNEAEMRATEQFNKDNNSKEFHESERIWLQKVNELREFEWGNRSIIAGHRRD